jgi:hypothetical protein
MMLMRSPDAAELHDRAKQVELTVSAIINHRTLALEEEGLCTAIPFRRAGAPETTEEAITGCRTGQQIEFQSDKTSSFRTRVARELG